MADDTSQLFVYKVIDGSPVARHNGQRITQEKDYIRSVPSDSVESARSRAATGAPRQGLPRGHGRNDYPVRPNSLTSRVAAQRYEIAAGSTRVAGAAAADHAPIPPAPADRGTVPKQIELPDLGPVQALDGKELIRWRARAATGMPIGARAQACCRSRSPRPRVPQALARSDAGAPPRVAGPCSRLSADNWADDDHKLIKRPDQPDADHRPRNCAGGRWRPHQAGERTGEPTPASHDLSR